MTTKQDFVDELTRNLANAGLKFDLDDNSITVHNSDSTPTVVSIEKTGFVGMDGKEITHSVRISKRCVNPEGRMLDLSNLGRWNVFTSILSTLKDDQGLRVVSRLNLYEGAPDVIKYAYAPMAYWAVWLAPGISAYLEEGQPNAFGFVQGATPPVDPGWFGIPNDAARQPAPFSEADFTEGTSFARARDLSAFAGSSGLTIEFPWDPGAVGTLYQMVVDAAVPAGGASSQNGAPQKANLKRTSLLTVETKQPHPLFGNGTLVRLQVPVTTESGKVASLVNEMNSWESDAGDLPPFFGSWCIDPSFSSPAYVMFVPSLIGRAMTILSLIVWMHSRHRASMGYLKRLGLA